MTTVRIDLTDTRVTGRAVRTRVGLVARLLTLDARFRDRRALMALSAERRADLGLGHSDIRKETEKPVWRA
jgi:uncharacterized protein YjiS (DUF1127 family)